ncbi:MAG: DnaA regulatory inactivator Hda [Rhodanobacteraceae bacterium]
MSAQLPLVLRWPPDQRFETFVVGANGVAFELARKAASDAAASWLYLGGAPGSGRTHLLIATCAAAAQAGRAAQYVSLAALSAPRAGTIRALGGSDVLALDDIDVIAADEAAEHALFDLYNRCRADASTVLFAAGAAPGRVGFMLPDLVSRLAACTQATLRPLSEDERREALRARAVARGIALDDAVLDWLFVHHCRDLGALGALLDRIDRASLAAKRRVTVPFLRELLADSGP